MNSDYTDRLRLVYVSATQLRVDAQPGREYLKPYPGVEQSLLLVALRGGGRFSTAALIVDSTVVGEGGCETAVPAATAPYYVYVVKSLATGRLAAIASTNPPPTGPAGYNPGDWLYVGCQPFIFGTGWLPFTQLGARYRYLSGVPIENVVAGADLAPVAIDLAAIGIPPTPELEVYAASVFVIGGGASLVYRLYSDTDGGTTPAVIPSLRSAFTAAVDTGADNTCTVEASLGFMFRERVAGGAGETATSVIFAKGFVDPLLDP